MSKTVDFLHQHYFLTMGPLIIITITAFAVMILEFSLRGRNKRWLHLVSLLGVLVALVDEIFLFHQKPQMTLGTMESDGLAVVFSFLLLITAALIFLFTYDYAGRRRLPSEHSYLLLFALVGALAMASAIDFITLYVGLELLSVASYVMVAMRKSSIKAVEGGIKYLIMGSIASAVLLYGLSFIYGITGSTNLFVIGQGSAAMWSNYPAIAVIGFLLILAGMGVKLSLVPFHMWTPDAYDGAPSPISAFLATLSKTASFMMLLRVLLYAFNGFTPHVFYWAGILAAITMVVGNLIALGQQNMKRLMAFSSVAQAGYVLIPIALINTSQSFDWYGLYDNIVFYLFAYTFATVGAFAIINLVAADKHSADSDALYGLWHKSPWLAGTFTVLLLSLAGMPLTGGFLGKFYIFVSTIHLHTLWLGIVLFATSVVSFYYYFGLIRKMFSASELGDNGWHAAITVSFTMKLLLAVCLVATLVLGLAPAALLHPLNHVAWF